MSGHLIGITIRSLCFITKTTCIGKIYQLKLSCLSYKRPLLKMTVSLVTTWYATVFRHSIIVANLGPLIQRQDKGGARADMADGVDKDVVRH